MIRQMLDVLLQTSILSAECKRTNGPTADRSDRTQKLTTMYFVSHMGLDDEFVIDAYLIKRKRKIATTKRIASTFRFGMVKFDI